MIGLASAEECLALDAKVQSGWRLGEGLLMESASVRLALALSPLLEEIRRSARPTRIVAVAGGANNGGDALALLRHLSFAGFGPCLALVTEREPKALAARQASSLAAGGIPVLRWNSGEGRAALAGADIILDGISGTGLSGPLRGEAAELLAAVNEARSARSSGPGDSPLVVSIDLPSGFRDGAGASEPRIRADITLSIEPRKLCLYAPMLRPLAGGIIPVDNVFPQAEGPDRQLALLETADIEGLRRPPPPSAHKGERGRLAIFAGSPGMSGALFLAARAAQAAGTGLVTLFLRDELFEALRAASPELLGGAILRPESAAPQELSRNDAVLAGPGWGRDASRLPLLAFLLDSALPLVLDADALRLLPETGFSSRKSALLLTPHPGEFESLSGKAAEEFLASPLEALAAVSSRLRATVLLKTASSWIMGPGARLGVIDGNEAGLGVAGSGDVLSGLIGGILAGFARASGKASRGEDFDADAFDAAALGSLVHLEAGRRLRGREGWFEASRIVAEAAAILGKPVAGAFGQDSRPALDPRGERGYSPRA